MKYPALTKVLSAKKPTKGDSAEYITLEIKFLCPKGFKPHDANMIQSPGPIPQLGEYANNAIFDPSVESIRLVKREPVPAAVLNEILHGDIKKSDEGEDTI